MYWVFEIEGSIRQPLPLLMPAPQEYSAHFPWTNSISSFSFPEDSEGREIMEKISEYWGVHVDVSEIQGMGVIASQDFEDHHYIGSFFGEIYWGDPKQVTEGNIVQLRFTTEFARELLNDTDTSDNPNYLLLTPSPLCPLRYINHSDNPNCVIIETVYPKIDKEDFSRGHLLRADAHLADPYLVMLKSIKSIDKGEELTIKYGDSFCVNLKDQPEIEDCVFELGSVDYVIPKSKGRVQPKKLDLDQPCDSTSCSVLGCPSLPSPAILFTCHVRDCSKEVHERYNYTSTLI